MGKACELYEAAAMAAELAGERAPPPIGEVFTRYVKGEDHSEAKRRREGHAGAWQHTALQYLKAWGLAPWAKVCRARYERRTKIAEHAKLHEARKLAELGLKERPQARTYANLQYEASKLRAAKRKDFAQTVAGKLHGYGAPTLVEGSFISMPYGKPGPYFVLDYDGIVKLAEAFGYKPAGEFREPTKPQVLNGKR